VCNCSSGTAGQFHEATSARLNCTRSVTSSQDSSENCAKMTLGRYRTFQYRLNSGSSLSSRPEKRLFQKSVSSLSATTHFFVKATNITALSVSYFCKSFCNSTSCITPALRFHRSSLRCVFLASLARAVSLFTQTT